MSASEESFELESSGSDTPPTAPLPTFNHATLESPIEFTGLRAHAAVRFLDADTGNYDNHDLPVQAPLQKSTSKFSLGRSLRSVTAYLSSKIGPGFQERDISIEGATPLSASFVVRDILHAGGANARPGNIMACFPLNRLVDVSGQSVLEKDIYVFKFLPPSLRLVEESAAARSLPSSSLYSSHGDVGLCLVFREPAAALSSAKDQYRKVEIRFVSSAERGIWLSYVENAYTELLLDSIRTGDGARFSDADMKRLVEESTRLLQDKPPPAVLERHIDFFLSSTGREEIDPPDESVAVDPRDVPYGGIIRIGLGDGKYVTRRFAHKRSAKRTESGELVESDYLVMHPTTVSQHMRMVPKLKVPVSQLRVVVEEEHWGNSFFLEQTGGANTRGESLLGVCRSQLSKFQNNFAAASSVGSTPSNSNSNIDGDKSNGGKMNENEKDFVITEIIELQTSSCPHRLKWLKWFEALLGKSTVYLSRIREGKEVNDHSQSPPRLTSLFLKSNMPGEPSCARTDEEEEEEDADDDEEEEEGRGNSSDSNCYPVNT